MLYFCRHVCERTMATHPRDGRRGSLLQTQGVISRRVRHPPLARRAEHRLRHRHQKDAFGGPLEGLDPAERDYAERYWRQMITDGQIDRFDNREEEERHLCSVTDDLFNQKNRIVLFDLTNFYFEGSKRGSKKAKFGRSKEKRSDCKLLVLALCVNTVGFLRYSEILEGNTSDPKSLPEMVKRLSEKAAPDG